MTVIGRQVSSVLCGIGVIGAALTLPGCSNGDEAAALPSSTKSATPLPSATSNEAAAKNAYTSFIAVLDRADSLPESSRKQQLSALMIEPQLSRVLKRVEELQSKNLTSYGKVAVHITSVKVTGNDATLRDCQDSSNAGIMNKHTRKKINRGVKKGNTKAYLVKGTDGQWRVSKYVVYGEGC